MINRSSQVYAVANIFSKNQLCLTNIFAEILDVSEKCKSFLLISRSSLFSFHSLSTDEQIAIGRMCKRLIDQGRLEFITNKGYHGDLVRYVDKDVTLENIALVISEKNIL